MLGTILIIILILLLIGALPRWGYSSGWGYLPDRWHRTTPDHNHHPLVDRLHIALAFVRPANATKASMVADRVVRSAGGFRVPDKGHYGAKWSRFGLGLASPEDMDCVGA